MAAKARITLARADDNRQRVSGPDALLAVRITAVSDFLQQWCRRDFVQTGGVPPTRDTQRQHGLTGRGVDARPTVIRSRGRWRFREPW